MALGGDSAQRFAMLIEHLHVFRVPNSREGVRKIILGRLYPLRGDAEALLNLLHGNPSGHAQTDILS